MDDINKRQWGAILHSGILAPQKQKKQMNLATDDKLFTNNCLFFLSSTTYLRSFFPF